MSPDTENLEFVEWRDGELVVDRYRLAGEIGRGGFGVVYRAFDERLHQRPVVVKFLLGAARRDEWIDRKFADEARALARIDHPGVVGVLDRGHTADGLPFLVMQHVEGVTLRSLITPGGLPLGRTAEIMRQIGRALAAAHACGILHRDLKPENIMVQSTSSGDFVRLIDFGIATIRDEAGGSGLTQAAGTPVYMAPEQFYGQPVAASDVFAMGVIAWEMLMGKPTARDAGMPRPDVPPAAVAAIQRAVSPDFEKRFQSAAEFGEELAATLSAGGNPVQPQLPVERIQPRVLDVAASRQLPIHKPAEVVALIRRAESGGLSAILEVDRDYSVSKEDVRSKSFHLEFPLDPAGRPAALDLGLRIECPDFEPKGAFKTIQVPPDGDAEPCTFLITPQYLGELRINLEVVRGDVLVASRTLKTEAVPSDRVPDSTRTLVSISLPVIVRAAGFEDPAALMQALERLLGKATEDASRAAAGPSEFTRMIGKGPAADAEHTRVLRRPVQVPQIPKVCPPPVVPQVPAFRPCPACTISNPPGAIVCRGCSRPLGESATAVSMAPRSKPWGLIVAIAAAVVVAIALIVLIVIR